MARELALAALREITPAATVGEPRDSAVDADGVLTLRFENRLPGYPGWFWTVSLAQVDGSAPTVLEAELMPGDGALHRARLAAVGGAPGRLPGRSGGARRGGARDRRPGHR